MQAYGLCILQLANSFRLLTMRFDMKICHAPQRRDMNSFEWNGKIRGSKSVCRSNSVKLWFSEIMILWQCFSSNQFSINTTFWTSVYILPFSGGFSSYHCWIDWMEPLKLTYSILTLSLSVSLAFLQYPSWWKKKKKSSLPTWKCLMWYETYSAKY